MNSVAIIIPACNAEAFVGEALKSAVEQAHPASAVVLVDDGSTDETARIAEKFGQGVRCLRQKNAGVSAARNRGAAETDAAWLLFLDADDRLRPDALATLVAARGQGNYGVVHGKTADFTRHSVFGREYGTDATQGPPPAATGASFWKSAIPTPGAAIIRRDQFANAGGWNERFNTAADRDLWCRLGVASRFAYVNRVVVERRVHGQNMSSDKNRARRQAVEVQLAFLEWCEARGIDSAFLGTSLEDIFTRNVQRAFAERAFDAAGWLAAEAGVRGIDGPDFQRARRLAMMPGFAREIEMRVREFFTK